MLKDFVEKQKLILRPVIARVQAVLVLLLLVLAYFLIVGPTWLFASLFRRSLLRESVEPSKTGAHNTYWLKPQGYGSAPELFRRQF